MLSLQLLIEIFAGVASAPCGSVFACQRRQLLPFVATGCAPLNMCVHLSHSVSVACIHLPACLHATHTQLPAPSVTCSGSKRTIHTASERPHQCAFHLTCHARVTFKCCPQTHTHAHAHAHEHPLTYTLSAHTPHSPLGRH